MAACGLPPTHLVVIVVICIIHPEAYFTVLLTYVILFLLRRSKRRKHAVDADAIVKLLFELSDAVMLLSSSSGDSGLKSIEMSPDFVTKLNEMLSTSHCHHLQLFADVSPLKRVLQVSVNVLFPLFSFTC